MLHAGCLTLLERQVQAVYNSRLANSMTEKTSGRSTVFRCRMIRLLGGALGFASTVAVVAS